MSAHRIETSEEDSGLWRVFTRNADGSINSLGFIWAPEWESWLMGSKHPNHRQYYPENWVNGEYRCDEPRFVALEDWLSVEPGEPIEGCATWHQALSAVVRYRKESK